MFTDEKIVDESSTASLTDRVLGAIECATCAVYKGGALSWRSDNSTVISLPAVDISRIFGVGVCLQASVNLVSIRGLSGELLHYHTSHLAGIVVRGKGWLILAGSEPGAEVERVPITSGDLIVIPRGVEHIFECPSSNELDYVALEFSDEGIDYQKHHR